MKKTPARGRLSKRPEVALPGQIPEESPGPESPAQILERCWAELVRCYRHSSVGRRLRGLVHQMNTPLQVLSFNLELLEKNSREELKYLQDCPPPVAAGLERLREYRRGKFRQFHQEVDNLQTLARLIFLQGIHEEIQGQLSLDLNQIYQEELKLYPALPFFKYQVSKKFHFCEEMPPIFGYYIDFSQSFRNLVDNALEAMEEVERRELHIETCLEAGWRIVKIGDTGVGIPKEIMARIFEPFFTTKGTPQAPRPGLGLFMARRLLSPYRGEIRVKSRPGETWVTVLLPVTPGP